MVSAPEMAVIGNDGGGAEGAFGNRYSAGDLCRPRLPRSPFSNRLHPSQIGIISPSKLRMKLLGSQHMKRKEGGSTSRASPSKIEDMEYAKRNLLTGDLDEEGVSTDFSVASISKSSKSEVSTKDLRGNDAGNQTKYSTGDSHSKEDSDTKNSRNQSNVMNSSYRIPPTNNLAAHSMRHQDEGCNGYDSGHDNVSTASFEFHGGEKMVQRPVFGPLYRHIPSKWNDAEKWLVNRQTGQANAVKKNSVLYQCNRPVNSSMARIAPESMITDQKPSLNGPENSKNSSHNMAEKFSFVSQSLHSGAISSNVSSWLTDSSRDTCDSISLARVPKELNHQESSVSESCLSESTDIPSKQSVSMRDAGTEMTPFPSQEPSRTGTPIENLTPSRSPISSITSSPRRSMEVDVAQSTSGNEKDGMNDVEKKKFSEKELKLKLRREIAALGLQLGKPNIASWAGKEAESTSSPKIIDEEEQMRKEYEARATAWEDAEKAKLVARYKQEQIKIQAWESHQREKYEDRMRKSEIRAENMRSHAEAAMTEKLRRTELRANEKRDNAEANKKRQAARTSHRAERIRRSGRVPSSHVRCLSWFF